MQRVTYYDSTLKQYVLVGNEHDTLTALGKLEDSLEKLEPKTFGEFMTRFRQRRGVSLKRHLRQLSISAVILLKRLKQTKILRLMKPCLRLQMCIIFPLILCGLLFGVMPSTSKTRQSTT